MKLTVKFSGRHVACLNYRSKHTRTCIRTHARTHACTHARTRTRTRTHTYIHTYIHTHTQARTHARRHARTHAHTHTHDNTHTKLHKGVRGREKRGQSQIWTPDQCVKVYQVCFQSLFWSLLSVHYTYDGQWFSKTPAYPKLTMAALKKKKKNLTRMTASILKKKKNEIKKKFKRTLIIRTKHNIPISGLIIFFLYILFFTRV